MRPGDPITAQQLRVIHGLFRRIGMGAEAGVRHGIAELTGSPSTKSLNAAQAWDVIQRLCETLDCANPCPIVVEWCPVYQLARAKLNTGNAESLPSQRQAWFIYHALREAQVADAGAYLEKFFKLEGGIIRTAERAWWVSKSLRAMAEREGRHKHPARRHLQTALKDERRNRPRRARPPGKAMRAHG